jgi:ribosome-associated protein
VLPGLDRDALLRELTFTTSRSGGPGGQHANKTSTQVALRWPVLRSALLTDEQKALLHKRLTADGDLLIVSRGSRSQSQNKEEAISRLEALLRKTFQPRKRRKRTKPHAASVRRRLRSKKIQSEKKQGRNRKPPDGGE